MHLENLSTALEGSSSQVLTGAEVVTAGQALSFPSCRYEECCAVGTDCLRPKQRLLRGGQSVFEDRAALGAMEHT